MKKYFKQIILRILWWQVNRLRARHNPIVVAVAGSVGKTSTKAAIAKVLGQKYRVQWQDGNFNDVVSVPYIFFGASPSHIINPFAWLKYFFSAEKAIWGSYNYDVVVVELGTDKPGDMRDFKKFLKVDYGILTAITPEHMANFGSMDDVAREELVLADISEKLIVSSDSIPNKYLSILDAITVSTKAGDCVVKIKSLTSDMRRPVSCAFTKSRTLDFNSALIGKHSILAQALALVVAKQLDVSDTQIIKGIESIRAFPGRMQVLKGKNGSVLIDDTYNASPEAVKAALDTLYEVSSKHKIAVLGQMNELGSHSEALHQEVGEYIKPKELDVLITLGADSNNYLAKQAEVSGCKVVRCSSPYQAGNEVLPLLDSETVVLLKGSQNGVFTEEATKILLANLEDSKKLVRQSKEWLKIKRNQFKDLI